MRVEQIVVPRRALQRRVKRVGLLAVADDNLDAERIRHESSDMTHALVAAREAIEAKDRVSELVPDLLVSLNVATETLHAPGIGRVEAIVVGEQRAQPAK